MKRGDVCYGMLPRIVTIRGLQVRPRTLNTLRLVATVSGKFPKRQKRAGPDSCWHGPGHGQKMMLFAQDGAPNLTPFQSSSCRTPSQVRNTHDAQVRSPRARRLGRGLRPRRRALAALHQCGMPAGYQMLRICMRWHCGQARPCRHEASAYERSRLGTRRQGAKWLSSGSGTAQRLGSCRSEAGAGLRATCRRC